jgi:hypothetical protein
MQSVNAEGDTPCPGPEQGSEIRANEIVWLG